MASEETAGKSEAVCPRCGRRFTCGAAGGQRKCWCMERPTLPRGPGDSGTCLCPECFDRLLSERAAPGA
ncbi:MAG: cysteine-rich CWC family protein [Candidatus Accumulibacter sp.]|nr:cysteine-rich CWC family protein [Accumulibacter sp.]